MQTQSGSHSVRGRTVAPLSAREIDREARAVWENIAGETGMRRNAQRVARLYLLCRDLQQAACEGARMSTVRRVLELIVMVMERSYMQPRGV